MKPTLKEVKEYFKDAETVRCLTSKETEQLDLNYIGEEEGVHKFNRGWWVDFDNDGNNDSICLWKKGEFAEIITYKNNTKMKTLSRKNYKRIYNIACSTWKPKLQNWYGNKFAIEDEITIKDSEYKLMRNACTPEQNELFDEIFGKDEKELEIGKWYKYTDSKIHLVCFTNVNKQEGYGFDSGGWQKSTKWLIDDLREATEEEVKSALIKEAEKRGFKEGVKFICLHDKKKQTMYKEYEFFGLTEKFNFENNELWVGSKEGNTNSKIFANGEWAEIIEERTYKIGQRFKYEKYKFILAQTKTYKICLISLESGNRWRDPIKVKNCHQITQEELNLMTDRRKGEFTLYKE